MGDRGLCAAQEQTNGKPRHAAVPTAQKTFRKHRFKNPRTRRRFLLKIGSWRIFRARSVRLAQPGWDCRADLAQGVGIVPASQAQTVAPRQSLELRHGRCHGLQHQASFCLSQLVQPGTLQRAGWRVCDRFGDASDHGQRRNQSRQCRNDR